MTKRTHAAASPASDEVAEQAARLRMAIARSARRMRQSAGPEALGISSLASLATIERLGPLSPSELAEIEGVKRPTATRIIARLAEEGLVERTADPTDARCALISATAEASELLDRVRQRKDAYLARRLRDLPERDRATLRRAASILERMLEEERG